MLCRDFARKERPPSGAIRLTRADPEPYGRRVADDFTGRYGDLLTGSYDCVDRIVLNAYYPLGHSPDGFRTWWRRWHYSFHVMDPAWGHLVVKMSGHPPFGAQVILNGHEYVACQARCGRDRVHQGGELLYLDHGSARPGPDRRDLIRQLAAAAREPAMPGVELQQQREAQAGRPALAGHLPQLITNQRPVLDQLIFIDLHDHARTLLAHPVTRRADTRLRLVTASLPTPRLG